jgi:hypothetical protein
MSDLLRQNSELRKDRIWNYSIPAWYVTLPDGKRFMTCPNAGPCAQFCYARSGTYRFSNVLASHTASLTRYLDDRAEWMGALVEELQRKKFRPNGVARDLPIEGDDWLLAWAEQGGAAVRIHDSGDFFDEQYVRDWLEVASKVPDVLFYAYTKEVSLFRSIPEVDTTPNFRYLFSTGGLQDHLIDPDTDRHADVFPTPQAITDAGYQSQDENDLLAISLPTPRIGITANNIRHFNKKMNGRRFSELRPRKP